MRGCHQNVMSQESLGTPGPVESILKGGEIGTFGSWTGSKRFLKKVKEWGINCESDDTKIAALVQYFSTLAQTEAEERLI